MEPVLTAELKIVNKLGFHVRSAAKFVKTASKFKSDVFLTKNKERCDGKSIMHLLMLSAEKGSTVTLEVRGLDQDEAFHTLKKLIESGFTE